jgi:hypothetical protein
MTRKINALGKSLKEQIHRGFEGVERKEREELERDIRNIKTVWMPINSIPHDGKEILVCNTNQGNVKQLVRYDKIHNRWLCKGESINLQADLWTIITEPQEDKG